MKVKSCPTLHDPMDCSLPGSAVPGILQARALEWVPWGPGGVGSKGLLLRKPGSRACLPLGPTWTQAGTSQVDWFLPEQLYC